MTKSKKLLIQDPYYQREAAKYAKPIPSRECILQLIKNHNLPMSRSAIQQQLAIQDDERKVALHRRLRAMESDGQLIFTRHKTYALPEQLNLIKGLVIGHPDGYGFLQVKGNKEDFFIPYHQMQQTMHGDLVLAEYRVNQREVRIIQVLEQGKKQIVGRFFMENGQNFVVPDDSRIGKDIIVPKQTLGAKMGQVVVVELLDNQRSNQPRGKIIEILGDNMQQGMEVEIALRNYDIPHTFSPAVKKYIKRFKEEIPEQAKQNRMDLRHLPLVTIDGEDARDFDDAVYCQAQHNGWKLWVAIADVSYYVRLHTALDKEAYLRGNSVYFPNRVVPMLPEILSNGLCSLNPQVDRLCMVCEMQISKQGQLSHYQFYEGVICSHARLTYHKVAQILAGDESLRQRYHHLVGDLEQLHQLYQTLIQARQQRGAIDFDRPESKFIFNPLGRIERIESVTRNDAHKMIEESMILANIAASDFISKHNEPSLYRIHALPSKEKQSAFRSFLAEKGLNLTGGHNPNTADYANLLEKIKDRPDAELIQTMLLRSLSQAVYSADNIGHFGLALEKYAHFTSPIRRYPDLVLHRSIKYLLGHNNKRKTTNSGGYHYTLNEIEQLGEHCSITERRADEATREVADWLKCEYMQHYIGEEFNGVISAVTSFGLFIRLDELFIDGLVHISSLNDDYYQVDLEKQRLVGERFAHIYRLGDKVKIRVIAVNLEQKRIDFALVSNQGKIARKGKTAKSKIKKREKQKPIASKKRKPTKRQKQSKNAVAK